MKYGQRVDSGNVFLGAAVGHRARIGGLVTLGYGAQIPNDAFLVGESLMRQPDVETATRALLANPVPEKSPA